MLRRELSLYARAPARWLLPVVFFTLAVAVFSIALGGDPAVLRRAAPGVLWASVLFSSLLAAENLFRPDWEDGVIEQMLLSPRPLVLLVAVKITAHWIASVAPLFVALPAGAFLLQNFSPALWAVLPLAAAAFHLCGGFCAALLAGESRGGFLAALLMLPLAAPTLIFAAAAAQNRAALLFLAALCAFSLTVFLPAAAGALRIAAAGR